MWLTWVVCAYAVDPADVEKAKVIFENGSQLYEEGNYDGAILAFQEVFRLTESPVLHYNLANCYERLGELQQAVDQLNLYRAVAGQDEVETLDRRLVNLERRLEEAAAVPAPPPVPVPVPAPVPVVAPPPARHPAWWLVGLGTAAAAGGGVGAYATWSQSEVAVSEGDRDRFLSLRTWNHVGLGTVAAGVVSAGLGLAIRTGGDPAPVVSGAVADGVGAVTLGWRW